MFKAGDLTDELLDVDFSWLEHMARVYVEQMTTPYGGAEALLKHEDDVIGLQLAKDFLRLLVVADVHEIDLGEELTEHLAACDRRAAAGNPDRAA